jgi:hypothetical protein
VAGFAKILQKLAERGTKVLMMDATHLKVHRTAANLREGGYAAGRSDARKGGLGSKIARYLRCLWAASEAASNSRER